MKTKYLYRVFCVSLVYGLVGCGYFQSLNPFSSEVPQEPKTKVVRPEAELLEQTILNTNEEQQKHAGPVHGNTGSGVEILWKAPAEPVLGYRLSYGLSETKLDNKIELPVSELESVEHPKQGKIYRYIIKNTPLGQPVYFTLEAKNLNGYSVPSKPFRVEPTQ